MLIKSIRAEVDDREAFDVGQRRWSSVAGTPGLLGQHGGWSVREPAVARIVAGWSDADAHTRFLAGGHDAVADAQRGSYRALDVTLAEVAHAVGEPGGIVLRSAWCALRAGRVDHALGSQHGVWMPAMHDAGMIAGLTALTASQDAMLVLSWWPDLATHDAYQRDRVPHLREAADMTEDVMAVHGDLVALEPAWTVPPTTPRGPTDAGG